MGCVPYRVGVEDAALVHRARAGERDAWSAIYDRYADRLHDYCWSILRDHHEAEDALHDAFLAAADRLPQLRDPDRLRPWLYAICRTQALGRARRRSKVVPTEGAGDMTAAVEPAPAPAAEHAELAALVHDAAGGLAPRDRAVLDLHLRHGLDGADLGEALGVGAHHATVLLSRVRASVERSLGALLVARTGRRECSELDALLAGWDGTLSPLLRKRVARHVDGCDTCGERRRRMVSPLALLAATPPVLAPASLRERVLDDLQLTSSPGGPPGGRRGGGRGVTRRDRSRILVGAAAAAVSVALLIAVLAAGGRDDDRTDRAAVVAAGATTTTTTVAAEPVVEPAPVPTAVSPVAPGPTVTTGVVTAPTTRPATSTTTTASPPQAAPHLVLDTSRVDFGAAATSAVLRFTNGGGQAMEWTVESAHAAVTVLLPAGTLQAGGQAELSVLLDRASAAEGDFRATLSIRGRATSGGAEVAGVTAVVAAVVEHPPVVGDLATAMPRIVFASSVCGSTRATAAVSDESAVTVVLTWRQNLGPTTEVSMTAEAGGRYGATIGPVPSPGGGDVTWYVTATDGRGNRARTAPQTLPVTTAC